MPHCSKIRSYAFAFFVACATLSALFWDASPTLAQLQGVEITSVYEIADQQAQSGDILTTSSSGLVRSKIAFDNHIFGILQDPGQPLITYQRRDNQGKPVARIGVAQVNVTTLGGPINAGDYITSSNIPGAGQKATLSGHVIGTALSSFGTSDGQEVGYKDSATNQTQKIRSGKIPVALRIEYAETSGARSSVLAQSFVTGLTQSIRNPEQFVQIFRYISAGVIILVSFSVGFLTFSRSIPKGVEAIGRNPLAEKAILFSIALNILFTVLTASIGVIAAAFILKL